MVMLLVAAAASAQELGRRFKFEELQAMVEQADVLVLAKATGQPVSQGADASGLPWQITFEVQKVVKGEFQEKTLVLHVSSPINDLATPRKKVSGAEFLLPLAALEGQDEKHFKLVADTGFVAGSAEARKLREIASGRVVTDTVTPLRVRIEAVRPPYESGKPALVRVILDNPDKNAVTYERAPLEIRSGELYLSGKGLLTVIDSRGNPAEVKETVHLGTVPPGPPVPLVIAPERNFAKEIDLAEYFDLTRAGNYMVKLSLGDPGGNEMMHSNTINVQVIPSLAERVARLAVEPTGPESIRIPSPEVYRPGDPVNGLAALLKPVKAEFEVGEQILVELRLINAGDVPLVLDSRLERTLLVSVQEQGGSPAVRQMFQRPSDEEIKTESYYPYAYLRRLGFWGKVININSWYGRDAASLVEDSRGSSGPSPLTASYERDGMTLFSFDEPGVYKVQATYHVKPRGGSGPKVWKGKVKTNPVFVRIVKPKEGVPVGPAP